MLSTAQIERVLGFNISHSVNSDYRTVASAVNSGVPVSALKVSELKLNGQLEAIARALAGLSQVRRDKSEVRSVSSYF